MPKTKLTLNVDRQVVKRAKAFAKERSTSVSAMVQTYLENVLNSDRSDLADTPVLRKLRGSLRNADIAEYRRYLERKYGS